MSRPFATLFACVLFSVGAYAADLAAQKADFLRHLETVKALTAALQRDDEAGKPFVREALGAVGARRKAAEELAAAEEYELASAILDEGYKKLTATLISTKSVAQASAARSPVSDVRPTALGQSEVDYERKLLSADALMAATKRVDSEKASAHRSQIEKLDLQLSQAKTAAAGKDWGAANRLLDEVLAGEKKIIASVKSDPANSTAKPASATARPGNGVSPAPMDADERRILATKTLRSVEMLRGVIVRRSQEVKVDSAPALGKIDKLVGEARQLHTSDPARALEAASGAYRTAMVSVQALFGK